MEKQIARRQKPPRILPRTPTPRIYLDELGKDEPAPTYPRSPSLLLNPTAESRLEWKP